MALKFEEAFAKVSTFAGSTVRMQRGLLSLLGGKDWSTNEPKQGDFKSSAEAKAKAEQLIARYQRDGYVERENFDELEL